MPDTVEAIEYFYEQGLTDGLPVIPPTAETVGAFLEAGGTEPGEVIGTRPSRNWVVTAQKVAVNAIMAGCKAEYAPVVLASIRALLKPEFNASAIAETAGTSAPLIVVNGPIRKELNVNGGWNLFGPGWRANATIGRTLRLVLMNVCREIPGVTDKSTFGHPGRYTFCIAENEEASPWEPYHVEHGMSLQSSAVGLFPALHPMEVFNQSDPSPEAILDTLSHTLAANQVCHGSGNAHHEPRARAEHRACGMEQEGRQGVPGQAGKRVSASLRLRPPTRPSAWRRLAPQQRQPRRCDHPCHLRRNHPTGRRWRGRRPLHGDPALGPRH